MSFLVSHALVVVALAAVATAVLASVSFASGAADPPVASRRPRKWHIHGEEHVDDYYWLRDKTSDDVLAYLRAENAYTEAVMKPTEGLQQALYAEMLGRIKQTDLSVPYRIGAFVYYTRTEEGKQYPIYCRKPHLADAPEQVTLDLNVLAEAQQFMSLGAHVVSDDGRLLAYSTDTTGFREYQLYVKDLETGEVLPDRVGKVCDVAWAADNRTIVYTTEDAAKRAYRVCRYVLGSNEPSVMYQEDDGLFSVHVYRSRDCRFVFLASDSLESSEVRFLPSDWPMSAPVMIQPRRAKHEYHVEHRNGLFYIRTNLRAKGFRLMTARVDTPGIENWRAEWPVRRGVVLEDVQVFADHLVATERIVGLPALRVVDLKTRESRAVDLPEKACAIFSDANHVYDATTFRFRYSSFKTPQTVYEYDTVSRSLTVLKRTEVLGGYDPELYETDYRYATAGDGVRVPISLVWRKDRLQECGNPLFLTGYGSYGLPNPIVFDSNRLCLLDRGFVVARAHIRGGGEMGEKWHEDGKMLRKRNTFTDFIACAEYLVASGLTTRDRMVIHGGSAGGLLIGATLNMRPDLCTAAILDVPFVDVINTMLDASLPLTIGEWIEWGNPANKRQYDYMRTYCPYSNLAARPYPHMLVNTSLNDSQVMYWEPAKYTAKLRTLWTGDRVLVLKTNMDAGHGGASGRYDALKELAFDYAFVLAAIPGWAASGG